MKQYSKFLRSLESMSNKGMIQACNAAGLEKIATGSSRVVYAINDKLVIKIALGDAGHLQNQAEMRVHYMLDYDFPGWKKYFAKMYPDLSHPRDMFIVMQRLETKFKGKSQYCKDLSRATYHPNLVKNRRAQLQRDAVAYMDELLHFSNSRDLHAGNVGITDTGIIKLIDFGLSNTVLYRHYSLSDRRKVKKNFLPAYS